MKRFLPAIIGAFVVAVVWGLFAYLESDEKVAAALERNNRRDDNIQAFISSERLRQTRTLEAAVKGDEEGERLLKFFIDRAIFGYIRKPTPAIERGKKFVGWHEYSHHERSFLVLPSMEEQRAAAGIGWRTNFNFVGQDDAIFTPESRAITDIWMGIRLAHEVSHAYDVISGKEPTEQGISKPNDYLEGEVRAHTLEIRLFDRATNSRFSERMVALVRLHPPPFGYPEVKVAEEHDPAHYKTIDDLFPPIRSGNEARVRQGSYNIARSFAYCRLLHRGHDCLIKGYQHRF